MKLGAEDKKKATIAAVVGVIALGALGYAGSSLFGGATPPPPQAPVIVDNTNHTAAATTPGAPTRTVTAPPGYAVAGAAEKVGSTSGQLDPTLHEEAMLNTESLVYSGSGRNIFSGVSEAPVAKPVAKIPTPTTLVRQPVYVPPPQPTGPPPLPPINLKFFGTTTATATGYRRAFLLGGDDVFLAAQGDVVQRKYRILSISPSSVLIEDIPNANKQTVPLAPQ